MATRDRNNPVRSKSSTSQYSLMEFMKEYPDDSACLQRLWMDRYALDPEGKTAECPKCEKVRAFKRYATKQRRQTWTCTGCGHHVQPTAGTIFEGSSTSLHLWFYAIYLMASTRMGISAKQLEREIGVTYKTAWRMFRLIRQELMADDGEQLSGDVEVDETGMGGKPRVEKRRIGQPRPKRGPKKGDDRLTTVVAAVERGGRVKAAPVADRKIRSLRPKVLEWIDPSSIVITDAWRAYNFVKREFLDHSVINHSARYVDGSTHTNTIEGFFGIMKPGIKGTYRKVSRKYLQGYLNEYAWRYSHRLDTDPMFEALVKRATR